MNFLLAKLATKAMIVRYDSIHQQNHFNPNTHLVDQPLQSASKSGCQRRNS